jgi:hypothetical protein
MVLKNKAAISNGVFLILVNGLNFVTTAVLAHLTKILTVDAREPNLRHKR